MVLVKQNIIEIADYVFSFFFNSFLVYLNFMWQIDKSMSTNIFQMSYLATDFFASHKNEKPLVDG